MIWLSQHPLECTFQKVMLSEILKLMSLIILHEWVYQGYLTLKFAVLTKPVQHVKRNFLFANQILSSSVPSDCPLKTITNFFNGPKNYSVSPLWNTTNVQNSHPHSSLLLVSVRDVLLRKKKAFFWIFSLWGGRGPCPIFSAHFQEVHFCSIRTLFLPKANNWNFKLFVRLHNAYLYCIIY